MMDAFGFTGMWLLAITCASCLVLLYYYVFVFSRFAFYQRKESAPEPEKPVSVIIAARNEYENLERNLKSILEQDYPEFEVVVVNDCSWDDSQKLLEYYQEVYSHLKICRLVEQEKYPTNKKFALTIGIKAAKYDHMLFTDADCMPASNQWIRQMQARFVPGKEIVLGFSPFKKYPGLLNTFIRYESAITAMAYFSAAIAKKPFMGVGRNLAYTKDVFFRHKGFANHQHIMSGDDDLFVNEAATHANTTIEVSPETFVYTEPKKDFAAWTSQKSRHISTGKYYKTRHKVFLGTYYAALMCFYGSLIALLIHNHGWEWVLAIYGLLIIVQAVILYYALRRLKYLGLIWLFPVLDVLYTAYIIVFGTKGIFTRQRKVW
jgi:glycosyltransferase involved in cell wall biosynthesis